MIAELSTPLLFCSPYPHVLNYNKSSLDKTEIKVEHFILLLRLVKEGKITELQAKQVLNKFYPKSFAPDNIEGKITDPLELEKIASKLIEKNPKAVSDYKAGAQGALNFLLGEIMKETNRRADFKVASAVFKKLLDK